MLLVDAAGAAAAAAIRSASRSASNGWISADRPARPTDTCRARWRPRFRFHCHTRGSSAAPATTVPPSPHRPRASRDRPRHPAESSPRRRGRPHRRPNGRHARRSHFPARDLGVFHLGIGRRVRARLIAADAARARRRHPLHADPARPRIPPLRPRPRPLGELPQPRAAARWRAAVARGPRPNGVRPLPATRRADVPADRLAVLRPRLPAVRSSSAVDPRRPPPRVLPPADLLAVAVRRAPAIRPAAARRATPDVRPLLPKEGERRRVPADAFATRAALRSVRRAMRSGVVRCRAMPYATPPPTMPRTAATAPPPMLTPVSMRPVPA